MPPKYHKRREKSNNNVKKDTIRMILTAHKGVSLVVMNTEDYIKKAGDLLNQPTCKSIPTDLTTRYKNKLITLLKTIKAEGGISEAVYRRLYPTGAGCPKFCGLPKIRKEGMALRPIVSSIGAVTYETSKELARILKPLSGRSLYQVQNTQDFIQQIQGIQLQPDQCIMSYDAKALFTSVPTHPAINIIKKLLDEDNELQQRTSMTVSHITCLLEFCLKGTYFTFQGKHYEQLEGAAKSSPISPILANLYMEKFEVEAMNTAPHPLIYGRDMICICNGIVTIQYHPSIVWLVPYIIEFKPSVQTPSCCNKKIIYIEHSQNANTQHGLSVE